MWRTKKFPTTKDEKTGLPIYSLYGESRRPKPEQLKDLDALVFDIQDVGARFYTYISTLGYVMEEAAQGARLPVFVLDRPNPIGGLDVEGPLADADKLSFIAYHTIPVRHGMTVGELARLFNEQRKLDCDLRVVKMENWRRAQWFDATGLIVGQPVAEHAEPDGGDALSGRRAVGDDERLGRARDGHAVRTGRRAVARRAASSRLI